MTSQEVARRPVGEAARREFNREQVNVIRRTVARDASDAELGMFLEVCARYQLDPFTKQVFFVKVPGRDGGAGSTAIIVGRDGLNAIANRHPEFAGFNSDVVREKDIFKVIRATPGKYAAAEGATDIGGGRWLVHTYEGNHRDRGDIVGAWCVAFRNDREPRYFYAPLEEYKPESTSTKSPWKKGQVSVMIEKCAISTALRLQFEITGLYSDAEMDAVIATPQAQEAIEEGIEWGDDERLAERLRQLFDTARTLQPDAYTDAKIKLLLHGLTDGERADVATEVEQFIVEQGGEVPPWPEADEGEIEPEAEAEAEALAEPETPEEAEQIDRLWQETGEQQP